MRLFCWCFVLLFFFCGTLSAQQNDTLNKTIRYDRSADLTPAHFDQKQIKAYKNDKDFDYSKNQQDPSWLERFWAWLGYVWTSFLKWLASLPGGSWWVILAEILKYAIIGGVIALIIWMFYKLNPGRAYLKAQAPPEVLFSEDERIIRENDIPALIAEALAGQNYRLAVRYYYLLALKKLKDNGLIDYQSQKTNHEYMDEIADDRISARFGTITRLYNFIWYGDFKVDARQFALAENEFKAIQEQLKTPRHA